MIWGTPRFEAPVATWPCGMDVILGEALQGQIPILSSLYGGYILHITPCMVYLPTFGWFLGQMLVNIPYMEHLGRVYRSTPRTCEHPQLPNSIISPVHFLRGGSSWSHSAHDHPKAGGPLGPGGQNSEQWFWAAQWILGSCAGELLKSGLSLLREGCHLRSGMNHRSSHLAMWKWSAEWTAAVGWFAGSIDLGFESSVKRVSASKEQFGQWSLGEPNFEDCGVMFSAPQNPNQNHVILSELGSSLSPYSTIRLLRVDFIPSEHINIIFLVVWNIFYFPFHIWDNPSHWRTHIFQDG